MPGDVKQNLGRTLRGMSHIERQERGDRPRAIPGADGAKPTLFRKCEACGAILLEQRGRIHLKLLPGSTLNEATGSDALTGENAADQTRRQRRRSKRERPPIPQKCG